MKNIDTHWLDTQKTSENESTDIASRDHLMDEADMLLRKLSIKALRQKNIFSYISDNISSHTNKQPVVLLIPQKQPCAPSCGLQLLPNFVAEHVQGTSGGQYRMFTYQQIRYSTFFLFFARTKETDFCFTVSSPVFFFFLFVRKNFIRIIIIIVIIMSLKFKSNRLVSRPRSR